MADDFEPIEISPSQNSDLNSRLRVNAMKPSGSSPMSTDEFLRQRQIDEMLPSRIRHYDDGGSVDQAIPDQSDQGEAAPRSLMGDIGSTAGAVGGALKQGYGAVSGAMQGVGQAVEQKRQDIHGYLMGHNAVSDQTWNMMGDAVDPDGQMPPSERNHYIISAAQQKDPMDLGPSAVEYARKRATMLNAAAASALDQGNLQSAAQRATEAHNFVLDGSNTQFQVGNDGQVHATVQPFQGSSQNFTMTPGQFREVIHGAHGMWDNLVEKGAANVISRLAQGGGELQQPPPQGGGPMAGTDRDPGPYYNGEAFGPPTPSNLGGTEGGLKKGDVEWVPNGNSGTGYWRAREAGADVVRGGGQVGTPKGGSSQGTNLYPNPTEPTTETDHPINVTKFGVNRLQGNAVPPNDADESIRRLVQTAYPNNPSKQAEAYISQRNQAQVLESKERASQNRGMAAAYIRAQELAGNTDNKVIAENARTAAIILGNIQKSGATFADALKQMHDQNVDTTIINHLNKIHNQQSQQNQQPLQGAPAPHVEAPEIRYDAQGRAFIKGPDGKPVPYQPGQ